MQRGVSLALVLAVLWCNARSAPAGQLSLGRATARPGQTVTVPVVYAAGAGPVAAGLATDIAFNPVGLSHPRCASGAALGASKAVKCAEPKRGLVRIAIYGLNLDAIPAGEVATVSFDVAPGPRRRVYRLRHKPTAATADGTDFSLAHRSGAIRVMPGAQP